MFVAKSMNRITSIPSQPAPLDVSRRNDGLPAIRSGHRPYDGRRSDAAIPTATAKAWCGGCCTAGWAPTDKRSGREAHLMLKVRTPVMNGTFNRITPRQSRWACCPLRGGRNHPKLWTVSFYIIWPVFRLHRGQADHTARHIRGLTMSRWFQGWPTGESCQGRRARGHPRLCGAACR